MIRLITHTAMLCIVLTVTSCKFSEECHYTGNVELMMDWESLWGRLQKPSSLNVLFYRNGSLPVYRELLGDTIYENIPSGETDLITFNQPDNTEIKGLEISSNAELHLPTYFEGNIRAVNECPMVCAFNHQLIVPIENTVKQTVTPLPVVKQLIFVLHVIKEGQMGEVRSCKASLSGVATGYSLERQEAIRSKATVFFPFEKEKENTYMHDFLVLGVNPPISGEENISKLLSVTVTLEDGEVRSGDIDLTSKLDEFSANIFKCEVNITITSMSANVDIVSWEQGIWNQITIQ